MIELIIEIVGAIFDFFIALTDFHNRKEKRK